MEGSAVCCVVLCFSAKSEASLLYTTVAIFPIPPAAENTNREERVVKDDYWQYCPLQPSPHQYIAVNENMMISGAQMCYLNHYLIPPICAENASSATITISDDNNMRYLSPSSFETMATRTVAVNITYSKHYNYDSTIAIITTQDNEGHVMFERMDDMIWLHGVVVSLVFLFIIILLVLSLVVVVIKFRTKGTTKSHSEKYRGIKEQEQEISNPHYIKMTINAGSCSATMHDTQEQLSVPKYIQHQTGENKGQIKSAASADGAYSDNNFANYSQEKAIDQSPEYAAVNRAKHSLTIENSVQTTAGDEWYPPGYSEVGELEMARKTAVTFQEQENPSVYIEPLKTSPFPVYAEVHKDRKKKKQPEDCSAVVEERERSQSPEYTEVDKVNKHSRNIVNQEKQEHEQHYYHSLENPEEHGCSGNIEGTVYTSGDSQEPKVIATQSMLRKIPSASTHTELVMVNEVNTSIDPYNIMEQN